MKVVEIKEVLNEKKSKANDNKEKKKYSRVNYLNWKGK